MGGRGDWRLVSRRPKGHRWRRPGVARASPRPSPAPTDPGPSKPPQPNPPQTASPPPAYPSAREIKARPKRCSGDTAPRPKKTDRTAAEANEQENIATTTNAWNAGLWPGRKIPAPGRRVTGMVVHGECERKPGGLAPNARFRRRTQGLGVDLSHPAPWPGAKIRPVYIPPKPKKQ